ncbi:MAG: TIGR04283 family arsenosugar biosynthesis glycosyltransferase [Gammaproteobacteria bacterium]|nr:TIGR04283 family arsenosugar biosynthesis glycosyltransferase [Gammaproteobacteria bacterium]
MISIIIPVLNEATCIESTLNRMQPMRKRGHQIILVDGGSQDNTVALAEPLVDSLLYSTAGRAVQMNTGAAAASGDIIWFVHADTLMIPDTDVLLKNALYDSAKKWGRFDIRLSGDVKALRIIERMMNWRSRLSGIATGDQGIFIHHETFERIGGFANIPLMEDIEISKRLKRAAGRPLCLPRKLTTSSRRWEKNGMLPTIILMWRLRLAYWMGANPVDLAGQYR